MQTPTKRLNPALALALGLSLAALSAALPAAEAAPPSGMPVTPPGLGRLSVNNTTGEITGAFVTLVAPSTDDIIENYASSGTAVFDRVAVPGYALSTKTVAGALVTLRGIGALAQVHDTPSSVLNLALNGNASATFTLSAGVTASWGENGSVELGLAGGNRTAALWTTCGPGALSLDAAKGTVTATAADPCSALFRARVLAPASESLISDAVEGRRLGAEVSVAAEASGGSDVASYGEANVIVTHADDNRVVVSVEPTSAAPTSVLVRFALPSGSGPVKVLVDGRPGQAADSLSDSLDATDDGGAVEYSVSDDGATGVLVVSLPDAGSHVVEIESVAAAAPPAPRDLSSPLAAAALGLAAALAGALVLFRRR